MISNHVKDAEERIKKARRTREKFYNEEAYKASTIQSLIKKLRLVNA